MHVRCLVVVLGMASLVRAQSNISDKVWNPSAGITWASRYITDGFNVGGDHPVWQPTAKLETPVPGVALKFWASLQEDRGRRQFDEYDYMLCYSRDVLSGSVAALNIHGYVDYWSYPNDAFAQDKFGNDMASRAKAGQKYHAGVSALNLLPLAGSHLVPSYNYYYWNPNRFDTFENGGRHEFVLQYGHDIPTFIPGAKKQSADVTGAVSYHDGVFGKGTGWSYSTAGVATSADLLGGTYSLGLNYQWSYDATIDDEDEYWATLSAQYKF